MVYIDLLVIQDLIYNYVILLGVGIVLTRITKFKRLFLSSVMGTIPLIFLFLNINNFIIYFISFLFSIIMSIISYSYKNIIYTLKNVFYMYTTSIFIAGTINLININIFPDINNYVFNIIILILISPIITLVYIKSMITFKSNNSNYYKVELYFSEKEKITTTGFLDTGNKLIDPYKGRPIILVKKTLVNTNDKKILLVPYNTLNSKELLKCIVPKKIFIQNIEYKKNFLIGLMDEVNIEGVDCILNPKLLERI